MPLQVLAAIERDHLPGHGGQGEDGEQGAADLGGRGAVAERDTRALPGELLVALARARQGGPGADRIHPDARGESEGEALGERPQPGLGDAVGDEMRGERPHALVQHVDHDALGALRQGGGEVLGEHEGGAQIGLEMGIPARARRAVPFVTLEGARIVDEHADRPERRRGGAEQRRDLRLASEVRREHMGALAERPHLLGRGGAGGVALPPVHGHGEAGLRQGEHDGAADALAAPRDQRDARDGVGDHVTLRRGAGSRCRAARAPPR